MSPDLERTVRLSVLDRLIDEEPRSGSDRPMTFSRSVAAMKAALLRDVEWLLNTRQVAEPAPESMPELRRSTYDFGLPDITSLSGGREAMSHQLAQQIEEAIQLFEPRLTGVKVSPSEVTDESKRQLRFTIEGLLRMDPSPERIVFDTVLDAGSGKILISDDQSA